MATLRSSDQELYNQNRWMFEGPSKFMDGKSIAGNKCGFFSFPRSGNTFLRKYLESLTGVITGSDLSKRIS